MMSRLEAQYVVIVLKLSPSKLKLSAAFTFLLYELNEFILAMKVVTITSFGFRSHLQSIYRTLDEI